jgi:S1-C subfamily serine protease
MEQQERDLSELHKPASQPTEKKAAAATNPSVATQPFTSEIRVIELPRPADAGLSLYAVGVLVDDQGHAAFPMFVEKKSIGDAPLPALTGDGVATTATFVGSDARTNLTVLQLATHSGTPVTLGNHKPQDGVLMLSIAPDGGARLVVWNNQHPEPGLAVLTDGSVSGFGFDGHFLGASTAKPIVDQLISFGEVRRAELGVLTMEVDKDDPLRRARPELGTRPAIRIVAVMKGSAAESAGIRADDLVLSIGGEAVGDAPTFAAVIATRRGQTILRVLRSSQTIDLTVNLQPKS